MDSNTVGRLFMDMLEHLLTVVPFASRSQKRILRYVKLKNFLKTKNVFKDLFLKKLTIVIIFGEMIYLMRLPI